MKAIKLVYYMSVYLSMVTIWETLSIIVRKLQSSRICGATKSIQEQWSLLYCKSEFLSIHFSSEDCFNTLITTLLDAVESTGKCKIRLFV